MNGKNYKYKFWNVLNNMPSDQKRAVIDSLPKRLNITKKTLYNYFNLDIVQEWDIPTQIFLNLCHELNQQPTDMPNYLFDRQRHEKLVAKRNEFMEYLNEYQQNQTFINQ